MTTVPPPFTYLERAKNLFGEVMMNAFAGMIFGPMENVIRNFTRKDFTILVSLRLSFYLFRKVWERALSYSPMVKNIPKSPDQFPIKLFISEDWVKLGQPL